MDIDEPSTSIEPAMLASALARAGEEAAAALVRHDERLTRADAELAEGALRRADMLDAQALVALRGGVSALEDIVLNDASMDVRLPTSDVVRAVSLVGLRRSLARRSPEAAFEPAMIGDLAGLAEPAGPQAAAAGGGNRGAPLFRETEEDPEDADDPGPDLLDELDPLQDDPDGPAPILAAAPSLRATLAEADALLARSRRPLASYNEVKPEVGPVIERVSDPEYGGSRRLDAWLRVLAETEALPAAAAAAVALDRWLLLEPSEHRGEAGFLLAAALLRRRGLVRRHLPALARGYRRGKFRWSPHQDEAMRLMGLLSAVAESARLGQGDLDRLSLARDVMNRRCEGRSKNSRLPGLVKLFVASPLVTTQMAAKTLAVTPQAVEAMLKELGSSLPRELTGRRRYRAWGVL